MISTFLIKTALLQFGIVIENVQFDVDNELIIVNYSAHGIKDRKIVSFQQIEELFKHDLAQPAGQPAGNKRREPHNST